MVAQVQALESENTRLKAEALELSAKVDEYENGKEKSSGQSEKPF